MCCLVSLACLSLFSPPAGRIATRAVHKIAQDNPGGCVLTHLQVRQTERVYVNAVVNSLVLVGGRWIYLFPQAPAKAGRVDCESRGRVVRNRSKRIQLWGALGRTLQTDNRFGGGSRRFRKITSGAVLRGVFTLCGRVKKLLTTDKSVQELRRLVIRTCADAMYKAAPALGNSRETEGLPHRDRVRCRARCRAIGTRRRLDFPANRSLCAGARMRASALVRRACGR